LDVVLGKNLRSNSQFFLDYLEQISGQLQSFSPRFEGVAKKSLLLQELLDNYRFNALSRYFDDYFSIEEKYFSYCTGIYLNLLRDRLVAVFATKKRPQFEVVVEILGSEKMEEYLNFVTKSLKRTVVLSDQAAMAANLVKLLKVAMSEFKAFMELVVESCLNLVPPGDKEMVPPSGVRASSFLFLLVNRIYVMQSEFIGMVQNSIYFVEIEGLKRAVFDSVKDRLMDFNRRIIMNIITGAAHALANPVEKKPANETAGVLERLYPHLVRYMQEIEALTNPEFKKTTQVLFYRELISLIEDVLLKMDRKARGKINYVNEFKLFFDTFNKVKMPALEGDILALQYLLLSLKTNEKDIWRLLDQPTRDIISQERIEKYTSVLAKGK
jgi:hypothetical protein